VWHDYQKDYIRDVKEVGRSVVLGGDGRADTPGHSAKYGTYSMVDLENALPEETKIQFSLDK
jgi:solute carrier family 8 (sodium/calcium exchanger)